MEETPKKAAAGKAKAKAAAASTSDHGLQDAGPSGSADRQGVAAGRGRTHTAQGSENAEWIGGAAAAAAEGSLGLNGAGTAAGALPTAGEGPGSAQGQAGTPDRLRPLGTRSTLGRDLSAGTASRHLVRNHSAELDNSSGLGAPTEQEAGQAALGSLQLLGAASSGNAAAAGLEQEQSLLTCSPDSSLDSPAWSPEHTRPHSAALSALRAPETPASSDGEWSRQWCCPARLWPATDPCCAPHQTATCFFRQCAAL